MRVAVYSGTFNPLHIGHMAIIRELGQRDDFGCVYLIVSPKNPLKDSISALSGKERFSAAKAALARHPELSAKALDIELRREPPHYTIQTLDELKALEPENEFVLVMGADNLDDIRRWRDNRRILSDYGVIVFPRQGFDLEQIRKELMAESLSENPRRPYKIELIDAPLVNISSTEIRRRMAAGEDVRGLLM